MCKDSAKLLNDEYVIRTFVKADREVIIFGGQKNVDTLSRISCTYNYTLCLYENNLRQCFTELEKQFQRKPYNLEFSISQILIHRNQTWSISVGSTANNPNIQEQERLEQLYIDQLVQQMRDYKFINTCKLITLNNSEYFYRPLTELFAKNKFKMQIQTMNIHTAFIQSNLTEKISNNDFRTLIENTFRFQNIKNLILQRLRLDAEQMELIIECLPYAKHLRKFDITFTEENVQLGITSSLQLRLFFEVISKVRKLKEIFFEFKESGSQEYLTKEYLDVSCDLDEIRLFRSDDVAKSILVWLNRNAQALIKRLKIIEQAKKFPESLKDTLIELIKTKNLEWLIIQNIIDDQTFAQLYDTCLSSSHIKRFNLWRAKDIQPFTVKAELPEDSQQIELKIWGQDTFSKNFKDSLIRKGGNNIKRLTVCSSYKQETDEVVQSLRNLEALEIYYCSPELTTLKSWNQITELEFFQPKFNADELKILKNYLYSSECKLKSFNLAHQQFGDFSQEEVTLFLGFIVVVKGLKSLKLTSCGGLSDKISSQFLYDISVAQSLKVLELSCMFLSSKQLETLNLLFSQNMRFKILEFLNLSYNFFDSPEDVNQLFISLAQNNTIKQLNARNLLKHTMTFNSERIEKLENEVQTFLDTNKKTIFVDVTRNKFTKIVNIYPWRAIYF